jgi:hypothetical protein
MHMNRQSDTVFDSCLHQSMLPAHPLSPPFVLFTVVARSECQKPRRMRCCAVRLCRVCVTSGCRNKGAIASLPLRDRPTFAVFMHPQVLPIAAPCVRTATRRSIGSDLPSTFANALSRSGNTRYVHSICWKNIILPVGWCEFILFSFPLFTSLFNVPAHS